jgi:hypothetical protein
MSPSAERDGKLSGFKRGFKLEENNWLKDFQKSDWELYKFEKEELNKKCKEEFRIAYLSEYEIGKIERENIEKRFYLKFGEVSYSEKEIQSKYLEQITNIFYEVSYLFQSWEERVGQEVFPKKYPNESLEDLEKELIKLIEEKRHQKSLRYLKEYFFKKTNSKLYYQTLSIDAELQLLRLNIKLKKIENSDYKFGLQKIENQLLKMKVKIEK